MNDEIISETIFFVLNRKIFKAYFNYIRNSVTFYNDKDIPIIKRESLDWSQMNIIKKAVKKYGLTKDVLINPFYK